jgi:UDP-glucose 4-epimerase
MKVIVFGGNGFIGSHLVDELLRCGHRVRVFDRVPEKYRPPVPGVDYYYGDFGDATAVAEALKGVAAVYHLVSNTVPNSSNLDPVADIQDNLIATVRLLELMVKCDCRRIFFLSSGGTVYGNPQTVPVPVEHQLRPLCSYGIVKIATEHYLFMFEKLYGLAPIVLRASNPYGPRQGRIGVQGVISTFLQQLTDHQAIQVWGDGTVVRDYLYVGDLVKLCVKAVDSGITGIFNAGSGRGLSINELIEIISEVTGICPEVHYHPERSCDVKKVVLDTRPTQETFSWTPEVNIRQGIDRHWQWTRSLGCGKEPGDIDNPVRVSAGKL